MIKNMNMRFMRAAGFTLLPVILTMSLLAAIAFLLNRDNGINTEMIADQQDNDRARYAAEAGLQAVNAKVQGFSCAGGFPVSGSPVTNSNFGGASYTAYAGSTTAGTTLGTTATLTSTGTYNGTSVTLTRSNVYVYQSATKTYTLQPNSTAGKDTYLSQQFPNRSYGDDTTLRFWTDKYESLLNFDFSLFPSGSRAVPWFDTVANKLMPGAQLSLYQNAYPMATGTNMDVLLVTRSWVEGTTNNTATGASWNTYDGLNAWTSPGVGYDARPVASTPYTATLGWKTWDITDMTNMWMSGLYPNNGMWLRPSGATVVDAQFVSSDNSTAANRPKIVFNYMLPCGATGPFDTPHGTLTLSAIADSFNDSGAVNANSGAATTIKTYNNGARENRILMQFDTSGIPTGATIVSATLRTYVSGVASATANTKSIWANALNESWVEGAGNNTNKSCPAITAGTSWNYSTGCTNWSYIHPPNTTPAWATMAVMPTARTQHMVASVNNKIYAIGGYKPPSTYFNTVEEYDPATNIWTTKANMPTGRSDAAAAVVNGKIYIIGGTKDGTNSLNTNEVYDPATNTWATKATMPNARRFLAAATANNKIYAIGGAKTTTPVKNNEEYDPATNTWTVKTQLTTAREWFAAQGLNGKVYAIGGWTGTVSLSSNEEYNPTTNTWAAKAAMPVATDSMSSAILGNKIYLVSGFQDSVLTKAVWAYDALNNAYTTQTNYQVAANVPAAAAVGSYLYSMGGDNGATTPVVFQSNYKYDPGIATPIDTAYDEATSTSPLASGFSSGWIDFDLKALAQEWVDGVRVNNGVVIYTEVADQFSINSRENSANKPQLIVTY